MGVNGRRVNADSGLTAGGMLMTQPPCQAPTFSTATGCAALSSGFLLFATARRLSLPFIWAAPCFLLLSSLPFSSLSHHFAKAF